MIGMSLFPAVAAATIQPYPVEEILAAFGRVCLSSSRAEEHVDKSASEWKAAAVRDGWVEMKSPPSVGTGNYRENADYLTFYRVMALDYDLFSGLLSQGDERLFGSTLLKKTVAGRDVYISTLAIDAGSRKLAECRLHDPLGDGITKPPVTKDVVARFTGRTVQKTQGWYRSTQFDWADSAGRKRSFRLHFGFAGKPLAKFGARYDPYALYGMTLVRSDFSQEIII